MRRSAAAGPSWQLTSPPPVWRRHRPDAQRGRECHCCFVTSFWHASAAGQGRMVPQLTAVAVGKGWPRRAPGGKQEGRQAHQWVCSRWPARRSCSDMAPHAALLWCCSKLGTIWARCHHAACSWGAGPGAASRRGQTRIQAGACVCHRVRLPAVQHERMRSCTLAACTLAALQACGSALPPGVCRTLAPARALTRGGTVHCRSVVREWAGCTPSPATMLGNEGPTAAHTGGSGSVRLGWKVTAAATASAHCRSATGRPLRLHDVSTAQAT